MMVMCKLVKLLFMHLEEFSESELHSDIEFAVSFLQPNAFFSFGNSYLGLELLFLSLMRL